ncbi:signal recognition particle receptor beta subunit-domain-containing protein [Melanogaster broomeanus]|nr:signal recognition particle receptor beta subunit-domain-containing protein [Melanogaster broomeanus]
MADHSQEETVISPTPEVAPLIGSLSAQNLALLSLAVTVLLFVVLSFTRRKSKFRGNALLLVGPPDSGKTAIMSNLAFNQTLPSHTSLQTNSTQVVLSPTQTLRVIDVPGHPRIRDQFREHLADAKAIAFVVDSSTISRNAPVVAEHLHHVLHAITSLPPTQPTPALLILAHKIDVLRSGASSNSATEVAISRVRTILERELEKRRTSQLGGVGMESLGGEGEGSEIGGLECSGAAGGAFKFSEWEGEVDFAATWVKVGETKDYEKSLGEDGLEGLKEWLDQLPK